ncbi:MAG: S41 family peptidase [Parvularculaceae bacterium]
MTGKAIALRSSSMLSLNVFSRIRFSLCLSLLLVAAPAGAEENLTAEQAREELATLYSTLAEEHIDLYAMRSRDDYDRYYNSLLNQIQGPINLDAFDLILQDLLAYGKIAHANTNAAVQNAIGYLRRGGKIIPLSFTYRDGQMVTDAWASQSDRMPPGARLTKIGGLSISEFETKARRIISADTQQLLRAQLESGAPVFLYLIFGPVESLEVEFDRPEGKTGRLVLEAVPYATMREIQEARPVGRPDFEPMHRHFEALNKEIFYLRPGPFFAIDAERTTESGTYEIGKYAAFIDAALTALKACGAEDLLIDLRGNPGGDASFSDLLFTRVADRSYRFASRYVVRAGANTKAAWKGKAQNDNSLSGQIAKGLAETPTGEVFSVDLVPVKPNPDRHFDGRVWVLVNRQSYSNAVVMAAMLQDYGFAKIIGEETADVATTYGAVEQFTLPLSGAIISYPKSYMVRPSGDETVRGVVPDFAISPPPIGETRDTMLEETIERIQSAL